MRELKKDTEIKVLETARQVFIEKGLNGARMQEIADRAGINKALLHYYYRSKEQLFDAVFEEIATDMFSQFSNVLSIKPDNVKELVRNFAVFYNQYFKENPHVPQFFFHEIWQQPEKLASYVHKSPVKPYEVMQMLGDKLPGDGDFEFPFQHMAANIMGMSLFPYIARPLFQRIFFDNNEEKYDRFLSEREELLQLIIENIFIEDEPKNKNDEPDENF